MKFYSRDFFNPSLEVVPIIDFTLSSLKCFVKQPNFSAKESKGVEGEVLGFWKTIISVCRSKISGFNDDKILKQILSDSNCAFSHCRNFLPLHTSQRRGADWSFGRCHSSSDQPAEADLETQYPHWWVFVQDKLGRHDNKWRITI